MLQSMGSKESDMTERLNNKDSGTDTLGRKNKSGRLWSWKSVVEWGQ